MASDVCIIIAVAEPDQLEALPGAGSSGKRFAAWASRQGYQVELVTDESKLPVTCGCVAEAFHTALGAGGQSRIVVAFMGHGLIRGQSEEYWLLTDWRTKAMEAVNHLRLCSRPQRYRRKQLGIVSDACGSLPIERAKWVEGNGVVDDLAHLIPACEEGKLALHDTIKPVVQDDAFACCAPFDDARSTQTLCLGHWRHILMSGLAQSRGDCTAVIV